MVGLLRYPSCMDRVQSMDEVPPVEELPLVLQRPRGHSGPLLELIARRIRAEAESEIETFDLRPRHVVARGGNSPQHGVAPGKVDIARVDLDADPTRNAVDGARKHVADTHRGDGIDRP